jgi:hypothetical protein
VADNQAIYGVGRYGVAVYGEVPVTVPVSGVAITATNIGSVSVYGDANLTPQSVHASATADTDVIITADATHTLVSVSAAFAQGSVGVVGVAIHQVDGVVATAQNNTAIVSADANVPTTGTVGSVLVGTAIAKASATAQPTGVFATGVADVSGEGFKVFSRVIVPVTVSAVGIATVTDVVVTADANTLALGSTAYGSAGTTTIVAKATTPVIGTSATATLEDVVVTADSVLTSESLSATGSVTDAVVTADAVTLPTGVLASATADTDIVITADSNHTLVSVSAAFAQGQVGVIGVAIVESQAVNATGFTGVTVITADSNYTTNSVEGSVVVDTDSVVTAAANTPVATDANVGSVGSTEVVAEANTLLTSVLGFGQMGGNVVVAEANTLTNSVEATGFIGDGYTFIEGVGEFAPVVGEEATGFVGTTVVTADNVYIPDSVFATVTADTDIIITADSIHTLISVVGVALNGGVGEVTADGVVNLENYSVEATGEVDNVLIVAEATILPTSDTAICIGEVGDNVVTADSNLLLDNVTSTAITGDLEVVADAIMSVYGTEAVPYFSDNSVVVAKALQSVSGFALQIDQGTESVSTVVTVFYPDAFAPDRMAYVEPRQNTNNRTAIVPASESRNAIVPADSQSRVVKIAA